MPETRSIGEILRDGADGRLERTFAEDREPYDFIGTTERLFDLLDERRVDYVLVGGLAVLQYIPARNTVDVDLIVAAKSLETVREIAIATRDRDFARGDFEGIRIDFLLTENKVFEHVRRKESRVLGIDGRPTPCATPQGLLILKLFALPSLYRQGENVRAAIYEADIAALLPRDDVDLDGALALLAPHLLASDIAELRRITTQLADRGTGFLTEGQKSESDP